MTETTALTFALWATAVTLGGSLSVLAAARLVAARAPEDGRSVAVILLLAYGLGLLVRPDVWLLSDLLVLAGAVGGALLLARALTTSGSVVVFLLVAAIVDFLSVSGGLTRLIIEQFQQGRGDLLRYLALVVPIGGQVTPIIGITDLALAAGAGVALLELGFRRAAVVGALCLGLLAALVVAFSLGPTPALPFLATAVMALIAFQKWWRST